VQYPDNITVIYNGPYVHLFADVALVGIFPPDLSINGFLYLAALVYYTYNLKFVTEKGCLRRFSLRTRTHLVVTDRRKKVNGGTPNDSNGIPNPQTNA